MYCHVTPQAAHNLDTGVLQSLLALTQTDIVMAANSLKTVIPVGQHSVFTRHRPVQKPFLRPALSPIGTCHSPTASFSTKQDFGPFISTAAQNHDLTVTQFDLEGLHCKRREMVY